MAGTPAFTHVWEDADVYIAPLGTAAPATVNDPFGPGWDLVGLLDGDAGFSESREEETNDIYAWGSVFLHTTRRNFKLTKTFTALEWNSTTRELLWPGSTSGALYVPRPQRIRIAFETRSGDNIRRRIAAFQAEVTLTGDVVEQEADIDRYEMQATIFPNPNVVNEFGGALLWINQESLASS